MKRLIIGPQFIKLRLGSSSFYAYLLYNHPVSELVSTLKSNNRDLREAEIVGILYLISTKKDLTNTKLIQLTGLPKKVLSDFKSSIRKYLKETKDDSIELNDVGIEAFGKVNLRPHKWTLVESATLEDVENILKSLRDKYEFKEKREYDQFFATTKSSVAKAQLLLAKGLDYNANIALIGDDDLVSLALVMLSPSIKSIKVFDIDERILETIKNVSKELETDKISTQVYDARKTFSKTDLNKYDVVLIDPPYTKAGAQVFIHRSIELLRTKKTYDGSYILFNFGVGFKNPEVENKIQQVISNFGLVIEDKISKFTTYEGAPTVGNVSSMYVLKTTPFTSVGKSILPEQIYTFEDTDIEKFPFTDHYTFKISKVPSQILNSKSRLQKIFGEFCRMHRLNVVNTFVDKFKGGGISFTYVLSTSNLNVHTWPEKGAVHIDLLTCSPIHNKHELGDNLSKLLKTKHVEIRWIE